MEIGGGGTTQRKVNKVFYFLVLLLLISPYGVDLPVVDSHDSGTDSSPVTAVRALISMILKQRLMA